MKSSVVTVSSKYQIVIPQSVRESAGIQPGSKMMVFEFDGLIRIMPIKPIEAYMGIAKGMNTEIVDDPERF